MIKYVDTMSLQKQNSDAIRPARSQVLVLSMVPRWDFFRNAFRRIQAMFPCYAPPKTNMEPKNGGLEDNIPFQLGDF